MRKLPLFMLLMLVMALSAAVTLAQDSTTIQVGQTVSGTISNDKPQDYYTFSGQAGETIAIAMSATTTQPGLDSFIEVTAPNGEQYTNDDSNQSLNSLLIVKLSATGGYTLKATRCCGESPGGTEGDYELLLQAVTLTPLEFGATMTLTINDNQPHVFLTLEDLPDAPVQVDMERVGGDASYSIELRDSDGMVVNSMVQGPDGRLSLDPLMLSGNPPYLMVVSRQVMPDNTLTGGVTATLTTSAIHTLPLTIGATVTGVLDDDNPVDHYRFSTSDSGVLRLEGSQPEGGQLFNEILRLTGNQPENDQPFEVYVYAQNGYVNQGANTGYSQVPNAFVIDPLQLSETGDYLLVVRRLDMNGTGELGTTHYTLSLGETETPLLTSGVAVEGGFAENQWELVYRFEGHRDQIIRITLKGTNAEYGPSLNVQGSQVANMPPTDGIGNFYLSANSNANATLIYEVTLPDDGVYLFRIGDSRYNPDNQADGRFQLLVETLND